jgi:hypothetical protein
VGELTKICAANQTGCVRSAIPKFIVNQFGLKVGDGLEWELFVCNGVLAVKVTPRKA